jgi:hypothetical protein
MALGAVDSRLPGELKEESLEIAEDVRDLAQLKLRSDVATSTGRAAASIRAFSNMRGAGVRGGHASVPYFGWLDFGGTIRHEGSKHEHTTAHLIRREVRREGRYIYPAADEESTRAAPRVERMLDRLFARAGFTG